MIPVSLLRPAQPGAAGTVLPTEPAPSAAFGSGTGASSAFGELLAGMSTPETSPEQAQDPQGAPLPDSVLSPAGASASWHPTLAQDHSAKPTPVLVLAEAPAPPALAETETGTPVRGQDEDQVGAQPGTAAASWAPSPAPEPDKAVIAPAPPATAAPQPPAQPPAPAPVLAKTTPGLDPVRPTGQASTTAAPTPGQQGSVETVSRPVTPAPVTAQTQVAAIPAAPASPQVNAPAPVQDPAPTPQVRAWTVQQLTAPLATTTLKAQTSPTGTQMATVRISPETLGPVTIEATVGKDGAVRVELSAASEAGRENLRMVIGELRRELSFTAPGSTVDLGTGDRSSDRQGDRPGAQHEREQPAPARRGTPEPEHRAPRTPLTHPTSSAELEIYA